MTTINEKIFEKFPEKTASKLRRHFTMSAAEWVDKYATGHLQDLKEMGAKWHSEYLEERCAMDYGYGFRVVPRTKIKTGPPVAEGDSVGHTTLVHLTHRLNLRDIFGDNYKPVYLNVQESPLTHIEGLGIVVEHTVRPSWLPEDFVIVSMVAECDTQKHEWKAPVNPG